MDAIDITSFQTNYGTEIEFRVRARSFLHNQVRSIVGSLERVGTGSWHPDKIAEVLAARSRQACGPVSPPQGLYLHSVEYANDPFAGRVPTF